MYAQYKYTATATAAQVLADLVSILTGTIDVNLLSASCDKVNSSIISTVPAGWTVADAAAGTLAQALTAPLVDDATKLKTMVLDLNVANNVYTRVYESWNATTHVGTNMAYSSDSSINPTTGVAFPGTYINLAAGGTIYISASARHCLIASMTSTNQFTPPSGIVEHTRNDPWNTVANGYPCSAFVSFQNGHGINMLGTVPLMPNCFLPYMFSPRLYNPASSTDAVGSNAGLGVYTPLMSNYSISFGSSSANGSMNVYENGANVGPIGMSAGPTKISQHLLVPIGLSRNITNSTILGGDISANCGLYFTTDSFGSPTDEISVGADTYVVWDGGYALASNAAPTASGVYAHRLAIKKA